MKYESVTAVVRRIKEDLQKDYRLQSIAMMDIGASTGGFTDCALQNGARKVFAVDVGYGQLAWKLRTDDRVVNMERTNMRNVTLEQIGGQVDFISIDVSFISLLKIMQARLAAIEKLKRKYGFSIEKIKETLDQAKREFDRLSQSESILAELTAKVGALEQELHQKAASLMIK